MLFSYFPFGFEDRIWDLIVSVLDHSLSFYFLDKEPEIWPDVMAAHARLKEH